MSKRSVFALLLTTSCTQIVGTPHDAGIITVDDVVTYVWQGHDSASNQAYDSPTILNDSPTWTSCIVGTTDSSCETVCQSIGNGVSAPKTCSSSCLDDNGVASNGLMLWCGSSSCQDSQTSPGLPYYFQCSTMITCGNEAAINSFKCCCQ